MAQLPAQFEHCARICILVQSPHRFYKNGDKHICRGGFAYAFDPQTSNTDHPWRASYRCLMSADYLSNCRSRIRTTGQWELDNGGKKYQWGIFRKYNHNHGPNYVSFEYKFVQKLHKIIKKFDHFTAMKTQFSVN